MFAKGYIPSTSLGADPTIAELIVPRKEIRCASECRNVFDRVVVSYAQRGGTAVGWELLPTFTDPLPYVFQLQVGTTNNPDADDWADVGDPVVDAFAATDPEQRWWGKQNPVHYRVRLRTKVDTYYSPPVSADGTLSRRDWRLAREILRKERLRMRVHAGQEGVLLKQRLTGEDCPVCLDHMTREVRDPDCPTCFGTSKKCGFWPPVECTWADISPRTYYLQNDGNQRGTFNDMVARARMFPVIMLAEGDVWVNLKTDDRYYIHSVQHVAEIRGVPLVANVELRLAPVTDIIYTIPVPAQDDLLAA